MWNVCSAAFLPCAMLPPIDVRPFVRAATLPLQSSSLPCWWSEWTWWAVTCFSFRNWVKSTENATKYQLVVPWLKSEVWGSDLFDQRHLLKEKLLWPITSYYYLPVSTSNAVAKRNFLCKSGSLPSRVFGGKSVYGLRSGIPGSLSTSSGFAAFTQLTHAPLIETCRKVRLIGRFLESRFFKLYFFVL